MKTPSNSTSSKGHSAKKEKEKEESVTSPPPPAATPAPATADPVAPIAPEPVDAAPAPPPPAENAESPTSDQADGGAKKRKREPYMSTSIPDLSVGDVRKCLNEIRKLGAAATVDHKLANGWSAGEFALKYLLGNYTPNSKKEKSPVDE
eukprot:jgi/Mesvir1/5622/Mv15640-RA.1